MPLDNFRTIDRETAYLLPPSVDEWLPERHLARFIVEVIDRLDLSAMSRSYRGTGSASYHPRCCWGFSCTGMRRGFFEPEAGAGDVRFGGIPLHRGERPIPTMTRSRRSAGAFSRRSRAVRAGAGAGARDGDAQDGHRRAGRHQDPRQRQPAQRVVVRARRQDRGAIEGGVAELLARAEAADKADVPDGMSIPEELARREKRLAKLARPAPSSKPAPRSGMSERRPSMRPKLARGRPRPRPPARSPAASRPNPLRKVRCQPIRSI